MKATTLLLLSAVTKAAYVVTNDDPIYDNPKVMENPCLPPRNQELAIGIRDFGDEETTFYPLAAKYRQTDDELYKVGKANNLWYQQPRWSVLFNEDQDYFKMSFKNSMHPERQGFLGIRKMKGPFFRSYYLPVIVSKQEDAVNLELYCSKNPETKDINTFIKLHKSSYFLGDDLFGFTRFLKKSDRPSSEVKLYYPKETNSYWFRYSIRNYRPVEYILNNKSSRYEAKGKKSEASKNTSTENKKSISKEKEDFGVQVLQEDKVAVVKKASSVKADVISKNEVYVDLTQKVRMEVLEDAEKKGTDTVWLKVKMEDAKKILAQTLNKSEI